MKTVILPSSVLIECLWQKKKKKERKNAIIITLELTIKITSGLKWKDWAGLHGAFDPGVTQRSPGAAAQTDLGPVQKRILAKFVHQHCTAATQPRSCPALPHHDLTATPTESRWELCVWSRQSVQMSLCARAYFLKW